MSTAPDAERESALAAELERAGMLPEAIEAFTRLQRARPDARLAAHIVGLRHDLANQTMRRAHGADWPPRLTDPFPGLTGAPEVGPAEVDGALLGGSILHHGCLIVRRLLDEEAALRLRDHVTRAMDARDRILVDNAEEDDSDWYREFEPGARRAGLIRPWVQEAGGMLTADSPPVLVELIEVLESSGLVRAITDYLGERPVVSFDKCVLRRVTTSHPTWHQDGSFLGEEVRTVDLWIALTECGAGAPAPGLDIVPRRFDDLLATQTHGAVFPNSIGHGLVEERAGDHPWMTPRFSPGDAILFDERFVHRTSVGAYSAERLAVETWCFAPSRFPKAYVPIAL